MYNRVTMAQVARRAGVSRSAVSAAFSDRPTTVGLNPSTRKEIHRAAEELGYRPNILSRSFIKQRSYLIGMLASDNYFLIVLEIIQGVEAVLENNEYSLLTYYHANEAQDQARHLQKAISRSVDGLILIPAREPAEGPNHRQLREMQEAGVPIVQLFRRQFPKMPAVLVDNVQAGYLAVRHLVELGHRRIAHVTIGDYLRQIQSGLKIEAAYRYEGYLKGMNEAGLEPHVIAFERTGYFGLGSNDYAPYLAEAARELAFASPRFTAVTTFSDYTTLGLIQNLRTHGVRVPEDLSIFGYDNVEAAVLSQPKLSTFRVNGFEIGRIAGELIFKMMEGQQVDDVMLTPEQIHRETTAAPGPNEHRSNLI